ncbi:MAG: glycoside hydrolase family 3 C-terminal domain-containing protein [Butyrivibrio sp.]|nr:glycoside hydrolase family 3 C-terminal domain-containing protein [Butyrivibrio sp.]
MNAGDNYEIYKDAAKSPKERASDLLSKMTLREKVGQLNQRLYGFSIYDYSPDFSLTDEFKEEVEKWGGLGTLYGLYRADPWSGKTEENGITPKKSMEAYNEVQRYVIEHSRLGIPALMSTECPHGHQALGGGILPVNAAAAASFDEKLLEDAYEACGKQLSDGHVDFALMSMLDVMRDPRWGRCEECYSEDPVLSARMARAATKGMKKSGTGVVAKHFCAQGEGTGGVNASAARIGERELREIHLPPTKAAVDAGCDGIMAAYNEIDGVYCHGNPHLLSDILRDEMGFKGVVMADGFAIDSLDKVTSGNTESGALALKSGVNISLWDYGFTKLEEAVSRGIITEKDIDDAVFPVLLLKFERGLFEKPYMTKNMGREADYGIDKLSLKMAEESVVLLKNQNNILPVREAKKIAVMGENADSGYALMGDYTPPRDESKMVSVLSGIREEYAGSKVKYFSFDDYEDKQALADEIKGYDFLLFVTGGSSSRYGGAEFDKNGAALTTSGVMECGEGMDRSSLEVGKDEAAFINSYIKGKTPVITVCVAGRPYVITDIAAASDGLLYAFYPGPFGGPAIAEIIKGVISPTGRMPASLPKEEGQIPCYYNFKSSYDGMKYCNLQQGTDYTFGMGLMYSDIEYKNVSFEKTGALTPEIFENAQNSEDSGRLQNSVIAIKMSVKNPGDMEAVAVPQIYLKRHGGGVTARVLELKNFDRCFLKAGEEKEISLELKLKDFAFYNYEMKLSTKAKDYEILVMDQGELKAKTTILPEE